MSRTVPHSWSDPTQHFSARIVPSGHAVFSLQLQSLFKLTKVGMNIFIAMQGIFATLFVLSSGWWKSGLNDDRPFFKGRKANFPVFFDFLGEVIGIVAVDIVTNHSGIGSLQGRGRDGHGRGLLLLLSGTALHLVIWGTCGVIWSSWNSLLYRKGCDWWWEEVRRSKSSSGEQKVSAWSDLSAGLQRAWFLCLEHGNSVGNGQCSLKIRPR